MKGEALALSILAVLGIGWILIRKDETATAEAGIPDLPIETSDLNTDWAGRLALSDENMDISIAEVEANITTLEQGVKDLKEMVQPTTDFIPPTYSTKESEQLASTSREATGSWHPESVPITDPDAYAKALRQKELSLANALLEEDKQKESEIAVEITTSGAIVPTSINDKLQPASAPIIYDRKYTML